MKTSKSKSITKSEKAVWGSISSQLRGNLHIGRDKFAKILGISAKTVWRWEKHDVEPSPKQKEKLAHLFKDISPKPIKNKNTGGVEMSSQIIKNFIGKVLNGLRRLDGPTFDQLVEEHLKARRSRELTSPHVHRKIELKGEPKEWEKLMEYVKDKQWKVVYDFGQMIIKKYKLSLLAIISALNAIGTAALRLGYYEEACLLFKEALRDCVDEKRRRSIHANLAYAYLRMNKLDLAEKIAKKTIEKSKSYDVGLYNLLCIACAKESEKDCQKYFDLLLKFFPDDVKNPDSVLGRGLRNDDDLKFIRKEMKNINEILTSVEIEKKKSVLKSIASPSKLAAWIFFIAIFVAKVVSAAMSETF